MNGEIEKKKAITEKESKYILLDFVIRIIVMGQIKSKNWLQDEWIVVV